MMNQRNTVQILNTLSSKMGKAGLPPACHCSDCVLDYTSSLLLNHMGRTKKAKESNRKREGERERKKGKKEREKNNKRNE